MGQERAVAGDQRDVRVDRPGPQALHVFFVGTRGQAHFRRYRFRWTEWRLLNEIQVDHNQNRSQSARRTARVLI
jgi:hypothetical protein